MSTLHGYHGGHGHGEFGERGEGHGAFGEHGQGGLGDSREMAKFFKQELTNFFKRLETGIDSKQDGQTPNRALDEALKELESKQNGSDGSAQSRKFLADELRNLFRGIGPDLGDGKNQVSARDLLNNALKSQDEGRSANGPNQADTNRREPDSKHQGLANHDEGDHINLGDGRMTVNPSVGGSAWDHNFESFGKSVGARFEFINTASNVSTVFGMRGDGVKFGEGQATIFGSNDKGQTVVFGHGRDSIGANGAERLDFAFVKTQADGAAQTPMFTINYNDGGKGPVFGAPDTHSANNGSANFFSLNDGTKITIHSNPPTKTHNG